LAVRGNRHEIDIQLVKTHGRMVEEILKFTRQLHKTSYGTGLHNCQFVLVGVLSKNCTWILWKL